MSKPKVWQVPELTIPEAAIALGISVRRLQALCQAGRVLGARKFGKRIWLIRCGKDGPRVVPGKRGPALGQKPKKGESDGNL